MTPTPTDPVDAGSVVVLHGLLDAVLADSGLRTAMSRLGSARLDITAGTPLRSLVVASLAAEADRGGGGRTVLAVTATSRDGEDLAAELGCLLPPESVALFPSWETLPHEKLSPRPDTVGARLAVLRRLAHPDPDDPRTGPLRVIVAPIRSLLQPIVAGLGELAPVRVAPSDEVEVDRLVEDLVDIGYARVDLVAARGDLAVRGGIVDVFPPTEEHPVRLEFFGDTVEEIRHFAVADQRTLSGDAQAAVSHGLWAPPCRELLLTPQVRARAKEQASAQAEAGHDDLAGMFGKLADGIPVEGMEALAPVLVDRLRSVLHDLPAGTHLLMCDPERVRTRATDLVHTSEEFLAASWAAAATGGSAPIDLGSASYHGIAELRAEAADLGVPWWTLSPFTADAELGDETVSVDAVGTDPYRGETDRALGDVRRWVADGWRVVLVFAGHGSARRASEQLADADVPARALDVLDAPLDTHSASVVCGRLESGFRSDTLRLVVLTESDLTGQRGATSTRDMRRLPSRRRNAVDLVQLEPGDYVVHAQHGVARYREMVRRTVGGGEREYLILDYAPTRRGQPGDQLFVPTDALDQLTRYVGGEQPTLNKLGGSDWAKTKGRARKAVREIAGELIRLYSARTAQPGHAFGPDTPWQRELEDAFPYTETPDQLAAINEVKADMEKPIPMDRIICGDVGYGKTEIAVRAAFKAAQDGMQVAVLVPTTLLAAQHYSTFTERFGQFPVTVRAISRFNTPAEQAQASDGVAAGSVDVVIGTHRLLQRGTTFKNLGMVIVDEEQRFGVEHKEFLKQMRTAVDVLSMSATPIPRTLEMSLTGIREMSTILTPPEERHPVLTFVGAYDEKQLSAAIRRELLREGQVFYIHNRVESIEKAARRLRDLVPEARIATAHGQMSEDALEAVMVGFWEKAYDVLVCTTIVEAGLDIASANTLIVERSDLLGLSQLHQLRGRVGRGRERAYAYFLYPPERPLTETAYDRLATIAQNSELGAGMAVAMKDLEIRGAGNLLGGEQSGHIAGVGFDLYVRMVAEAVADFRGEPDTSPAEVKVDLPVDANLPHSYIPGERLRMEAYRKLAAVDTEADVDAVAEELTDRYGDPPEPVANLLAVARLRATARRCGLADVAVTGRTIRFAPVALPESVQLRMARLYPRSTYKQAVSALSIPMPAAGGMGSPPLRDRALLDWCRGVLTDLALPTGEPATVS